MKATKGSNGQSAVKFLKLVVSGKIDEAYEKYIDMKGKHHNVYTPKGFSALMKGMKDAHIMFPKKKFTINNVFGDGDLVATHSKMVLAPGKGVINVVHMFRFRNSKIVEMWDCGVEVPKKSPNKDGAF